MTINEAYGLSEYVDERIKALEHRTEKVMSDKRCCMPPVNKSSIPFLIHKELEIPIYEAQKAYEVAIDYLRSKAHVRE